MGVAAAFSSPMLVSSISNFALNPKLQALADAQAAVGGALNKETRCNMYLQFLQQMVQREGGLLTEEAKDASEVIDSYASVTSAVRGISYGLANAV